MHYFNQKGISQIIILCVLMVGLVIGLYLIQHSQILKSKADYTPPDYQNPAKITLLGNAYATANPDQTEIVFKSSNPGIGTNPAYYVEYQPPFNQFMLVILNNPPTEVRQQAEQDILNTVTQSGSDLSSLCALNFKIIVPSFVNNGLDESDNSLGICKNLSPNLIQHTELNN